VNILQVNRLKQGVRQGDRSTQCIRQKHNIKTVELSQVFVSLDRFQMPLKITLPYKTLAGKTVYVMQRLIPIPLGKKGSWRWAIWKYIDMRSVYLVLEHASNNSQESVRQNTRMAICSSVPGGGRLFRSSNQDVIVLRNRRLVQLGW